MQRIIPVTYEEATGTVKDQFDDQIRRTGKITNMKRTLLRSEPAYHALMTWYTLREEVLTFLDEKATNYFCHAISTQNDCLVCSTFFRKIFIDEGENPESLTFSERDTVLINFGRDCAKKNGLIPDEQFDELRKYFTEGQIVSLTAFAGLMIATNLINNTLKVDLDEHLVEYTKR